METGQFGEPLLRDALLQPNLSQLLPESVEDFFHPANPLRDATQSIDKDSTTPHTIRLHTLRFRNVKAAWHTGSQVVTLKHGRRRNSDEEQDER
jgi:hypothetical protein